MILTGDPSLFALGHFSRQVWDLAQCIGGQLCILPGP